MSESGGHPPGTFGSLLILAIAVGFTAFLGFAVLDPLVPFRSDDATVTDRFEKAGTCSRKGGGGNRVQYACTRFTVGGVTGSGEQWSVVGTSREAYDLVVPDEAVTIGRSRLSGRVTLIDAAGGTYRSWRSWAHLIFGAIFLGAIGVTVFVTMQAVSNMLVEHTLRNARLMAAATIVVVGAITLVVVLAIYAEPMAHALGRE